MTRFPPAGGGTQMAYTYVRDGYPDGSTEGETLYHVTENRAYVYDGTNWIEQTVTDHAELSGIGPSDHHSRYTDSEASDAAPVNDVNGQTGSVSVAQRKSTGRVTSHELDDRLSGSTAGPNDPINVTGYFGVFKLIDYIDLYVENRGDGQEVSPVIEDVRLIDPDGSEDTIWSGSERVSPGSSYSDNIYVDNIPASGVKITGQFDDSEEYSTNTQFKATPAYKI